MKRFLFVLLAAFIATLFIITSFAHSGRTDSQGGHYNHSTGDYHYHHGHPPHDHYDTDGDGIKDYCQYGYYDNTNHNQGGVATTKKDAPDKDASDAFDIGKFFSILIIAAVASFLAVWIILGFLYLLFEEYMPKRWDKVFIIGYVITIIVIASIIYNA